MTATEDPTPPPEPEPAPTPAPEPEPESSDPSDPTLSHSHDRTTHVESAEGGTLHHESEGQTEVNTGDADE